MSSENTLARIKTTFIKKMPRNKKTKSFTGVKRLNNSIRKYNNFQLNCKEHLSLKPNFKMNRRKLQNLKLNKLIERELRSLQMKMIHLEGVKG